MPARRCQEENTGSNEYFFRLFHYFRLVDSALVLLVVYAIMHLRSKTSRVGVPDGTSSKRGAFLFREIKAAHQ